MILSNEELKKIYFGAYSFEETEDGYLQAYQYTKAQMDYFRAASDFWYDRCMASTSKTLEFTTEGRKASFDYKIIWAGSQDSVELCVNGRIREIVEYGTDEEVYKNPKHEYTKQLLNSVL